jgi:hypothetical protein
LREGSTRADTCPSYAALLDELAIKAVRRAADARIRRVTQTGETHCFV